MNSNIGTMSAKAIVKTAAAAPETNALPKAFCSTRPGGLYEASSAWDRALPHPQRQKHTAHICDFFFTVEVATLSTNDPKI